MSQRLLDRAHALFGPKITDSHAFHGDETKIRFKLKLQTMDVTGKADAMVAPASSAK